VNDDVSDTPAKEIETPEAFPGPPRTVRMGLLDDVSASLALFILEHLHAQRGPLGGMRRRLASRLRFTASRFGKTALLRRLALADARYNRVRVKREFDDVARLEKRLKERVAHHERRLDRSSDESSRMTTLETTLDKLDATGSQEMRDRIEVELVNVSREHQRLHQELRAADAAIGDLREALDLELAQSLPRKKSRSRFVLPFAVALVAVVAFAVWRRPRPNLSPGQTRPLAVAREHAQACLLPGASVAIVAGIGVNEEPLSTIERFDPSTRAFRTLPIRLPRPTFNHVLVPLDEFRFLLIGGETTFSEPAHRQILLIDFAEPSLTEIGLMTYARRRHRAVPLPERRVLIVGGEDDTRAPDHSTIEVFDVNDGTSRIVAHLPVYLQDFTLTPVPLGFLIAGGQDGKRRASPDVFLLGPDLETVTTLKPMSHPRYDHTATLLDNGRVVVAGGFGSNGRSSAAVEILNNPVGGPTRASPMLRPRAFHCAAALEGARLLVTGGAGGSSVEDEAEVFDFSANRWFSGGRLADSRNNHVMVELKPAVFLLAGGYAGRGVLRSAEILVPRPLLLAASRPAGP